MRRLLSITLVGLGTFLAIFGAITLVRPYVERLDPGWAIVRHQPGDWRWDLALIALGLIVTAIGDRVGRGTGGSGSGAA